MLPLLLLGIGLAFLLDRLDVVNFHAYEGHHDGPWILAVTEDKPATLYTINVSTKEKYKVDRAAALDRVDPMGFQVVLSDHNQRFFDAPRYGFRYTNRGDRGISGYILPDGKHLIYAVRRSNAWDVVLSTLNGKDKKEIATGLIAPNIAIAPEGQVLNMTFIRDSGWSLEIYSARTGKKLSNPINNAQSVGSYPSPDGQRVLYWATTQEGKHGLYLADVRGKQVIALMEGDTEINSGAITPDGKRIVYQITQHSGSKSFKEFWTADLTGDNRVKVYTSRDMIAPWSISPSGRYLVVLNWEDDEYRVIDLEANSVVAMFRSADPTDSNPDISFSAGDETFIYRHSRDDRLFLSRYNGDPEEEDVLSFSNKDDLVLGSIGGRNKTFYLHEGDIYTYDFSTGASPRLGRGAVYDLLPDISLAGFSLKEDILELGGPEIEQVLDFDGKHFLALEGTSGQLLVYRREWKGFEPIETPGVRFIRQSSFVQRGRYIIFEGSGAEDETPNIYVVARGQAPRLLLKEATFLR